ncbi:MAG TPA: flagellar motor protein [Bryobacteraceae bacterium]|nr:flagellar motor protein [Bryobacteraceae bacterium]
MAETNHNVASAKPDLASISGIVLALAGILGGLILEKGSIRDVAQITAALIVLGGTLGATLLNTPLPVLSGAFRRLNSVFLDRTLPPGGLIEEIIGYAAKARKNGLVSLEQEAQSIEDPFLSKALNLAVDGTDLQEIRKMLELEIGLEEQTAEAEAKVFESAGGYSPTIGIIGAVLGLIQVMKNLANIDEVGRGIAVAFVATVYGVALANLFLLPAANKIKARVYQDVQRKELMLEGVIGIVEGLNPKLIRSKLEAYARSAPAAPGKAKQIKQDAAAGQPARAEG